MKCKKYRKLPENNMLLKDKIKLNKKLTKFFLTILSVNELSELDLY